MLEEAASLGSLYLVLLPATASASCGMEEMMWRTLTAASLEPSPGPDCQVQQR